MRGCFGLRTRSLPAAATAVKVDKVGIGGVNRGCLFQQPDTVPAQSLAGVQSLPTNQVSQIVRYVTQIENGHVTSPSSTD